MTTIRATRPLMSGSSKAQALDLLKRIWAARILYLLLLPTFGLIFVFSYGPILMGIYYSFCRYDGMHAFWIGLENYRRIFQDPALVQSYRNMAIMVPFYLVTGATMPLFVAYLIYRLKNANLRYWFRVLYTVPMVVPGIVVLLIWIFMYTPSGGVNTILDLVGLHGLTITASGSPRSWLGDQNTALGAILFMGFPWVSPMTMLIFLAGLEGISVEMVEAAKVDGATGWRMFWNIELPMILGQLRFIIVTTTIGVMQGFGSILVLTRGGPGYSTMVPAMRMYDVAMPSDGAPLMGFGSAIGVFLFLIIMLVTILNFRVLRASRTEV